MKTLTIEAERFGHVRDSRLLLAPEGYVPGEWYRGTLHRAYGTLRGCHFVVVLPGTVLTAKNDYGYEVPPLDQLRIME